MRRFLTILCFIVVAATAAMAQGKGPSKEQRQQWMREMCKAKLEYLSKELNLNQSQQEEFTATYSEMEKELHKVGHDTREYGRQIRRKMNSDAQVSDVEYDKASEALFELKGKENEIEMRYYEKFRKVLTPQQLFKLKIAEQQWTRELMKHRNKK